MLGIECSSESTTDETVTLEDTLVTRDAEWRLRQLLDVCDDIRMFRDVSK